MKNIIKQEHIGFGIAVAGLALLSLTFLSYLMSNTVVSGLVLPTGIILLITGIIVIKSAKRNSKK